jgi:hypothetical protein
MEYINGYKYTTEVEATEAVEACNEHYLPKLKESDVTKNWVGYQAELNEPTFFYILHHKSLNKVLGEPTKIEITENGII